MRYLSISLYHPRAIKGGAQYVAKDLFDAADQDPDWDAFLLSAIGHVGFDQYRRVGASITLFPDSKKEFAMASAGFDGFYNVTYDPRATKALVRFLTDTHPDIIHLHHSILIGLDAIDIIRSVLPKAKIFYTLHEYIPICSMNGQLFRYSEREICSDTSPDQCVRCVPSRSADDFLLRRRRFTRAFEKVHHFIAPSGHLHKRYTQWGLPAEKISVVPNGHKGLRPPQWNTTRSAHLNIFGFFGQFLDAKGVDVLLKAGIRAANLTRETIVIKLFGGNRQFATEGYLRSVAKLIADCPDNLKVEEYGEYSRDNVFNLMASVDWVVVPSVWPETFALVVSEAWDAKRPVIASSAGALGGERIVHDRNGMVFPPGSVEALADLILISLGNSELWSKLSNGIVDEVSVNDAWEAHTKLFQAE